MVERVFGGSSLNIAIQDGADAGQSVPHVHTHIIPRREKDLDHRGGSDVIYEMMDGDEGNLKRAFEGHHAGIGGSGERRFAGVDNDTRRPRSTEEMQAEADMLAREMEEENVD